MIPSISPRQDIPCAVCSRSANEEHHVLHKSMGGSDDAHNLLALCRGCHRNMHGQDGRVWVIEENSPERLCVTESNHIVMERWHPGESFSQARFIHQFRALPRYTRIAGNYFRYLDEDAMMEIAEVIGQADAENWQAMAKLLTVAKRRMPYGERSEKFAELVRVFGIRKSKGYKLVAALSFVEDRPELFHGMESALPSPDAVLLVASNGDPEKAAELLTERVSQNPRYSPAQFREDLRVERPEEPEYHEVRCECGAVFTHPIRRTT